MSFLFLVTLFRVSFFICSLLTVANLVRNLGSLLGLRVRLQYLFRLFYLCWITGGHAIHLPIEELLLPSCIEITKLGKSASRVAGLQFHVTTPGLNCIFREKDAKKNTVHKK